MELLVYGFVKEIEQLLNDKMIIPDSIYKLCFNFYYSAKIIYCLCESTTSYIASLHEDDKWSLNIFDLDSLDESSIWILKYSGIYYKNNYSLPTKFYNKITKAYNSIDNKSDILYKHNQYHIIFKCGGSPSSSKCQAVIINEAQLYQNKKKGTYIYE